MVYPLNFIEMSVELKTRKYIRGQVTRLFNEHDKFTSMNKTECKAVQIKLVSYSDQLNSLNTVIQKSLYGDGKNEEEFLLELQSCDDYSDKLNTCFAVLQLMDSKPEAKDSETARSLLKSPVVPLPVYASTESENVEKFLVEFESAIATYSYTERDKLLLLKQQVSGRASILLENLEISKQTYTDAKKLLKEALASRSLQKFNVIKQLSEMKLEYGTDPFSYIGKITNVTETFSTLEIKVDDILQYFIWQGMNESFKAQLVNVTNHVRPSLEEIKEKFFEASERYMDVTRKFNERGKSSTSLAVNVKYEDNETNRISNADATSPRKKCTLCQENHARHKCIKYKEPEHKLRRLAELNGCKKCANIGHTTDKCDFDDVHKIKTSYEKLKHIRTNLLEIYHREFMNTLIKQATDKKDRYAPVNHKQISIGDIVLIKDDGYKPVNYPMGIVKEVFKNINGEVTAAKVLKGKTNEITKRHVTSLIPLLRKESDEDTVASDDDDEDAVASKEEIQGMDVSRKRPRRKAAEISRQKFKNILNDDISD
ncbi:uncharacterized protein LOC135222425 [Macrobrachium nipponense]|uniref:uncharacterized protein LOC135222425 n=1 Tax=Macrobrachium nipponense TaxID=159736 RepID=UPI0030C8B8C6